MCPGRLVAILLFHLVVFAAGVSPAVPEDRPKRPPPPARAEAPPQTSSSDAAALRQQQAELKKLLAALAEASEKYRTGALRFICEETLIRSEFNTSNGRRQKEEIDRSEYLLARDKKGEMVERRRPLAGGSAGNPSPRKLGQPEPFLWSLLFSPRNQLLFNYRLAGQEVVHFRLATVVEFDPILPFVDGSEITQWSGRAYVDSETLDLLRVEAEPSGQEIRLDAATQDYREAFRIIGIPLRRRPRLHLHEVDFAYERDKLRLPSLSITRQYVATQAEERTLQSQVMQIFADYRMFQVETEETIKEIREPARP